MDDAEHEELPKSISIELQIGYDMNLLRLPFLENSHYKAESFIRHITNLAQDYFMQIQRKRTFPYISWKIENDILRLLDVNITSDELCPTGNPQNDTKIQMIADKRRGRVPLILFTLDELTTSNLEAHVGCAEVSCVCDANKIKRGVNFGVLDVTYLDGTEEERYQTMARTMAHELGHMVIFVLYQEISLEKNYKIKLFIQFKIFKIFILTLYALK